VAELIGRLYPGVPKIELFCRGAPLPGWDAWGNEAETTTHNLPAEAGATGGLQCEA